MISLLLVLAIAIAYIQVRNLDFVGYDDQLYITKNSYVQDGITLNGAIWAFTTDHDANWFPLTWLSHMLDCELYGLNPLGHHWTNLLLHMANTILLFLVLNLMTETLWRSAFVAFLFALHPLHVESVAWISERKDVLCTFFGMLTILAYCRYVKKPIIINYLLIILFLSMGLMAKPMLVTLPFVLLLLDFWPLQRFQYTNSSSKPGRIIRSDFQEVFRLISEKIPLFIPVLVSSILTFMVQRSGGATRSLESFPLQIRIANAFVSYVKYVAKAVWPAHLSVFYPHPGKTFAEWQVFGALMMISMAVFFALRALKHYPYIAVGLFWYLGTLIPVIGLVQVGSQAMADRYTYIPLIGIFIIVAWGASDLTLKWHYQKIVLTVSAVIILSIMTVRTFVQVSHWENAVTLFENAVKIDSNNTLSHNNLGIALYDQGNIEKSAFHFREALRIEPYYIVARVNLARVLSAQGNLEDAIRHLREALKINPKHFMAHYQLGILLLKQKNIKEAYVHFAEVIKLNPDYAEAYGQIGIILAEQGKYKKAKIFFLKALQLNPDLIKARQYLEILENKLSIP
ncbi:MAG: tetratricopeptide repeat protein [Desulfobacterales bacterium]